MLKCGFDIRNSWRERADRTFFVIKKKINSFTEKFFMCTVNSEISVISEKVSFTYVIKFQSVSPFYCDSHLLTIFPVIKRPLFLN